MEDLALSGVFFQGSSSLPMVVALLPSWGDVLWWSGAAVLGLIVYCIIAAFLWRFYLAKIFFGPRDDDD